MKPFRERNPVVVGLVGLMVMAVLAMGVFFWQDLPVVGGGDEYTAEFGEAAGIKPDDEVRVAGVKVGEVRDVELAGDHVNVKFVVKGAWIGDQTVASIKIKTLLGQKNLVLDPLGTKELDPNTPIPRNRTVTPYDVNDAFGDLSKTVGQIDTQQLAASFQTLASFMQASTPQDVKAALDGLSALSKSISNRDQDLKTLLAGTAKFTKTVGDRSESFGALLRDGATLLAEFQKRKDAIKQLLAGTKQLSAELKGLIADNNAQIGPALEQLDRVTEVLQRNQNKLEESLRLAGPFYRLVGNTVGNGKWIDGYICGLIPPPGGSGCNPKRGN
jgi:phospholipid/cholesterol/gamma-HCH transport system substrate-binding protein